MSISMMRRSPSISRRRFGSFLLGGVALPWFLDVDYAANAARIGDVARAQLPSDGLPRSLPELQGVQSESILAFLEDIEHAGLEVHSFMLARGGSVIAEGWWWPYGPQRIHMTHSLTKSVMVNGVGIAMAEGKFGLDDKVVSFFPEHVPADASANLKAMAIRDLLTMQTGHDHMTSGSEWRPLKTSWIAEFMKIPVVYPPGTKFVYTSAASYLLSAIVTKTTGLKLVDYLKPRLLDPMGITHFQWDVSPEGVTTGGNGLSWTTADSLKLGMLYSQKGVWNGRQLLPAHWVAEASCKQVANSFDGYGYHWHMGQGTAFLADGLFTQLSIVFPDQDAVLAVFSAVPKEPNLLTIIWKHFPSAFEVKPLPASPGAVMLARREAKLRLLDPLTLTSSPTSGKVSGRAFKLASNDQEVDSVVFNFTRDQVRYTLTDSRGSHDIVAGLAQWHEQNTTMTGARLHHEYEPDTMRVVAGAVWRNPDALEMTWQYVESAFRDTVLCRFDGDRVAIERHVNVNSGELKLPMLNGTLA
jgi:CubicO group peptidase (beta-lactamase class C family)